MGVSLSCFWVPTRSVIREFRSWSCFWVFWRSRVTDTNCSCVSASSFFTVWSSVTCSWVDTNSCFIVSNWSLIDSISVNCSLNTSVSFTCCFNNSISFTWSFNESTSLTCSFIISASFFNCSHSSSFSWISFSIAVTRSIHSWFWICRVWLVICSVFNSACDFDRSTSTSFLACWQAFNSSTSVWWDSSAVETVSLSVWLACSNSFFSLSNASSCCLIPFIVASALAAASWSFSRASWATLNDFNASQTCCNCPSWVSNNSFSVVISFFKDSTCIFASS